MKKIMSYGFALMLGLANLSHGASLFTIYQNVIQNNFAYKANAERTKQNNAIEKEARSAFLPHLSASLTYGYADLNYSGNSILQNNAPTFNLNGTTNGQIYGASVVLNQTLFNYSAWKKLDATQLMSQSGSSELAMYRQRFAITIAEVYFDVIRSEKNLSFIHSNLERLKNDLHSAAAKGKQGEETELSIDKLKYQIEELKIAQLSVQHQIQFGLKRLSSLSGEKVSKVDKLGDNFRIKKLYPDDEAYWLQEMKAKNIMLSIMRTKLEAANDQLDANQGKGYPTVYFGAEANQDFNNDPVFQRLQTRAYSVYVGVKVPIFSGGYDSASADQAASQYQGLNDQYEEALQNVSLSVEKTFNQVSELYSKVQMDQLGIQLAEKTLKDAQLSYIAGVNSINEYLLADQDYYSAQKKYTNDVLDYMLAKLRLEQLSGRLNDESIKEVSDRFK